MRVAIGAIALAGGGCVAAGGWSLRSLPPTAVAPSELRSPDAPAVSPTSADSSLAPGRDPSLGPAAGPDDTAGGACPSASPAPSHTAAATATTVTSPDPAAPAGSVAAGATNAEHGTVVRVDLDGSGCTAIVAWRADQAELAVTGDDGTTTRFALGQAGDQCVIGDWDGDRRVTPALYRPSTGVVYEFAAWASPTDPEPAATARRTGPTGGRAAVVHVGDHDEVRVDPPPPSSVNPSAG